MLRRLIPLPVPVLTAAPLLVAFALGCGDSARSAPAIVAGDAAPDPAPAKAPPKPSDTGTAIETGASTGLQTTPPVLFLEPKLANAGAATCTVGEAVQVGEGGKRLQSLEVGFGAVVGLVAWPVGKGRVAVARIDRLGSAARAPTTVAIPGARNVYGIEALGDRFALLTHDLCPDQKYFFKCLHAQLLDRAGKPLGEPITEVTREWVREEFHERIGPDEIWVLRSHMYIPPVINSFGIADGKLSIGVVHAFEGGDELSWARGFAVRDRHWYALVESEQGRPSLVSGGSARRPLHWLSPDSKVLALDWHDGALVLLFAPVLESGGTGRPRVALLGEGGKPRAKPRKIAIGEPLPAPFDERVEAMLSKEESDLLFSRQNPAGDAIGDPLVVGRFPRGGRDDPRLALTWTGERFIAVWSSLADQPWKIHAAPIDCRPGGRTAAPEQKEAVQEP